MARIDENDFAAVKAQADIVDIVSHYLPVEKKGKDYVAVCPFHNDHDPSMRLNTRKQIYKCFVCGAGGDAISFVRRYEKLTFPQAVKKVADLIGYKLHNYQDSAPVQNVHQKDFDLMNTYSDFCKYELESVDGVHAKAYLSKRKINEDIIKRFEIGYAPDSKKSLHFLNNKGVPFQKLNALGLIRQNEYGLSAFFYDRIMIPIHDIYGHPVGFTARTLSNDKNVPKYLNTPDSEIYNKGELIFNYHRAKEAASRTGRVILTEGAMDVIGFEKAGIHEAIANLGTACTDRQIELIKALRVPVIVCYDFDKAGRKACADFCKKALAAGISIQISQNDLGKDPDEIFNQYGAKEVEGIVQKTIGYVDFLFDYLLSQYNLENYNDKKEYAQKMGEAIRSYTSDFERAAAYQRLKEISGFDLSATNTNAAEPETAKKGHRREKKSYEKPVYVMQDFEESGLEKAEKSVLTAMLFSKAIASRFRDEIGFFQDERHQLLAYYIYDYYRTNDFMDKDALYLSIEEEGIIDLLDLLYQRSDFLHIDLADPMIEERLNQLYTESIQKMEACLLDKKLEALNKKISRLQDPIEKAKLALEKRTLIAKKHQLRLSNKEG